MNLLPLLQAGDAKPVRVGLVGAGEFGATFIAQARRIPGLIAAAVCDLDPARAEAAVRAAGLPDDAFRRCHSKAGAEAALAAGQLVIVEDSALLLDLPLDVVLEATGHPEAAAATAAGAIAAGRHVVMATKEAEIVVGPLLRARAEAAGLVHTPVDGDQPSLLIGLIGQAALLGLPVVAAGKASESDVVLDLAAGTATAWGRTWQAPDGERLLELDAGDLEDALAARRLPGLALTTVPDLCEMGIVANHTALVPDRPELHSPIAHTCELPRLFRPKAEGGLLEGSGRVDMFNCLRRKDEISFAGGVFVVVLMPDDATGRLLAGKGIPAAGEGRYVMLHNPVHLLGVEAPVSVLAACRLGIATGGLRVRPRFDLVGRASRELRAGERLEIGRRHAIDGLEPLLLPARPVADTAPVPYYLAAGCTLREAVPAGTLIEGRHVTFDESRTLLALRREQDRLFGAEMG
jgi:predicted homoserine dehydrogenase-like protein